MATNNTSNRRLNGLYALAYMGVNPTTPNNFVTQTFDPTVNDWQNFTLGDEWLNTLTESVWKLVSLEGNQATWVRFSTGGSGAVLELTGDTGGPVLPTSGNINIISGIATDNSGASVYFLGTASTLTLNLTDANSNTFLGTSSGVRGTSGTNNDSQGFASLASVTGSNNSAFGGNGLQLLTSGSNNLTAGQGAGGVLLTGSNNILLGHNAGLNYTGAESSNIMIGNTGTLGESNIIRIGTDGSGAGQQNATFIAGSVTIARGITATTGNITAIAGNFVFPTTTATVGQLVQNSFTVFHTYGSNNLFIGKNAGNFTLTTASSISNIGIGVNALDALTTATTCVALGTNALGANATSNGCTALGNTALGSLTGGSGNNTAAGKFSLTNLLTGANNIALGYNSGSALTGAESGNILIGYNGDVGVSNEIVIGSAQTKCFIEGIAGVTTTVADAVPVLISASTSQLGVTSSSIRYKENIEDLNSSSILQLRPVKFDYKERKSTYKQYGLIAEEVADIMPDLVVKNKEGLIDTIKYQDLPILLLREIQRLSKRVEELESKLR